jgi:hypothetical protein
VATFSDLFARLDPDPRVRGKQFELVCKWFLSNDPVYKHELRRVWLWGEWTGRWGGDARLLMDRVSPPNTRCERDNAENPEVLAHRFTFDENVRR